MAGFPIWLLACFAVMALWGAVGITQKLATNYLSAEWTTITLTLGQLFTLPFVLSGFHPSAYSLRAIGVALASGVFSLIGAWSLFAAMRKGGKASIVMPLTALYPGFVVLLSPSLFGDHVSGRQILGILLGLVSGALLSR